MLLQALFEKGDDLALEVWLASESDLLASICLKKLESCFALLIAGKTQSMLDHHLPDEVVFSVFDHTEAHNVKESIAIGIWHQRVCFCSANQLLKAIAVKFLSGSMDR